MAGEALSKSTIDALFYKAYHKQCSNYEYYPIEALYSTYLASIAYSYNKRDFAIIGGNLNHQAVGINNSHVYSGEGYWGSGQVPWNVNQFINRFGGWVGNGTITPADFATDGVLQLDKITQLSADIDRFCRFAVDYVGSPSYDATTTGNWYYLQEDQQYPELDKHLTAHFSNKPINEYVSYGTYKPSLYIEAWEKAWKRRYATCTVDLHPDITGMSNCIALLMANVSYTYNTGSGYNEWSKVYYKFVNLTNGCTELSNQLSTLSALTRIAEYCGATVPTGPLGVTDNYRKLSVTFLEPGFYVFNKGDLQV